jgi:hypothetical protein
MYMPDKFEAMANEANDRYHREFSRFVIRVNNLLDARVEEPPRIMLYQMFSEGFDVDQVVEILLEGE